MLITIDELKPILESKQIDITGILHIGAHNCEEMHIYDVLGVSMENIVWVDAIPNKVLEAHMRGIPNVYHAVITDKDNDVVVFHISNNGQSSSILDMGAHLQEHPGIDYISDLIQSTSTIDTFFEKNQLDASKYIFWNFDIQGAELLALKGAIKSIVHAKILYLEVNEKELYKNCGMIDEIDTFLAQYHFKRVLTKMTQHGWGDAVYVLDQ